MSDLDPTGHAKAACGHIHGFNRGTMWAEGQLPVEASEQLADLAALAAALPQACSQLSGVLEQALDHQVLSTDSLGVESDPAMAIGVARLHLDTAREVALDLYRRLDAAHNATAHIISEGADEGQETVGERAPTSGHRSADAAGGISEDARRRMSGQRDLRSGPGPGPDFQPPGPRPPR